jgi:uncharacterized protein Smg (DUF494 family)
MNNVLQALIHFFKSVGKDQSKQDPEALAAELRGYGISLTDLENTLADIAVLFLSRLKLSSSLLFPPASRPKTSANQLLRSTQSTRVFSLNEARKISRKSRGFLFQLEQSGILDQAMRESIIDKLMGLNQRTEVPLSQTKWIVFQALFQHAPPDHLAYLEWLLFENAISVH